MIHFDSIFLFIYFILIHLILSFKLFLKFNKFINKFNTLNFT